METPKRRLFGCIECGGDVCQVTGPGRRYHLDDRVWVDLPDDFVTRVCDGCGEQYTQLDDIQAIERLAEEAARRASDEQA